MAPLILRIDEVNMTNCCKQLQRFFEKHGSMDCDLLIAYWMLAGYLNPVQSVHEAYERGHDVLRKLRHERKIQSLPCGKISTSVLKDCRHEGPCTPANIGFDDLIGLQGFEKVALTNGMLKDKNGSLLLIDGNHLSKHIEDLISSADRLKCMACFNPMPDSSLRLLLEKVDNLSVLLVRGCESASEVDLSLENLKALSVLEISSARMWVPGRRFKFSHLTQLKFLNLSGHKFGDRPGENFSMLKQLRCLVLQRCYSLKMFQSLKDLSNLEVLDAPYCGEIRMLGSDVFRSPKLRVLDLRGIHVERLPPVYSTAITHLSLPWSDMYTDEFAHLHGLEVLELSATQKMHVVDLSRHQNLVLADLSNSYISFIHVVSGMVHLRKLILRYCQYLQVLPQLGKLESLRVLDIRGCEKITHLPDLHYLGKLEELDLSGTRVRRLPSFPNPCSLRRLSLKGLELDSLKTLGSLLSLVELDLSEVKISSSDVFKADFLQCLEKLEILNLSGTSVAEIPELGKLISLKQLLLADCPCLNTPFDVKVLVNLEKLELPLRGDSSTPWKVVCSGHYSLCKLEDKGSNAEILSVFERVIYEHPSCFIKLSDLVSKILTTATDIDNVFKRQLEMLRIDLEYIQRRVETLKNSPDSKTAGELLRHLMDAANSTEDEFTPHSQKLQQLLQTIVKLKRLIPRTQMSINTTRRKKESKFITGKDGKTQAEDIVRKLVRINNPHVETALYRAYTSLTDNQRECLLCFSIFPWDTEEHKKVLTWRSLVIRKKTLIYWWVGEGFIDHDAEKNVAIEEIGEEILKVLMEKGFIEPVAVRGRETGRCCMHPFVHSFVTDQAKRSGFFDFSNENSNLTPKFTCPHRAAILKSQESILSSCQLWRKYSKSPEELKTFESVRTLFNVNESVVYIQPEWFSMMKDLSVLHLGNWHPGTSEHIEFGGQKFLEELKNMKKLKLFSLRGVSAINKLPDSLCKLTSLMILDLRECHDLLELPACIGSLKNLTHLDISNCRLLYKLPKGVSSLSKLEVFKGFVVYEHQHGKFHSSKSKVCSFRDLMKLRNLRELSIVANQDEFPGIEELKVLEEMLNLRKLKISWITSSIKDERKRDETCGDRQVSRREFLGRIEKLSLCCFPGKTKPDWLQLKSLQELRMTGGGLQQLHDEGRYESVKTLRLRNLPNLVIEWKTLKAMFPELTCLETYKCQKLGRFPCDDQGIWRKGVCSEDRSTSTYARKPASRFVSQ